MSTATIVNEMLTTRQNDTRLGGELMAECVELLTDCAQACVQCADDCLAEQWQQNHMAKCIRLNQDCADICVDRCTRAQPPGRLRARHRRRHAERGDRILQCMRFGLFRARRDAALRGLRAPLQRGRRVMPRDDARAARSELTAATAVPVWTND